MILTKRDWIWDNGYVYSVDCYADIEADLINFNTGDRVLPAKYFHDRESAGEWTFIKRYEPGDKGYPNGGYELRAPDGTRRSFDLDQVILHPDMLKKNFKHLAVRIEEIRQEEKVKQGRGRPKKDKPVVNENVIRTGRRGRPALNPEEKARRDAEKAAKPVGTGRRGRPKMSEEEKANRPVKPVKETTGRRGRPALTEEERLKRDAAKAEIKKKSGGKRGRPSSKK